ncbi:MAG: radical SAM protein [Oscillospiraceae bacterium]|jgi:putative methyltransferase|nr:radical SAM protein [Oscillospiraceae bacterium]
MKKQIYLVQTDVIRSSERFRSAYLPYAVAQLWAYAAQFDDIRTAYNLAGFVYLREKLSDVVGRLKDPFLVGFSCYVWNTEYNKALASAIKNAYPECHIVFGGHNVPPNEVFLREFPYIDFLLHGEGEIPFAELLRALERDVPNFDTVPGLSRRTADGGFGTNPSKELTALDDLPSPYLMGLFDALYAERPDIQWSIVWETNRGCPYQCAYCDWGKLKAKIRCMSMERLLAEIAWIGAHKIEFIWGSDANFGILPRDEDIADALIAQHKKTGYPFKFYVNYAKQSDDRVFRIAQKLNEVGIARYGTTLSLQSMSPEVLSRIGRKNFDAAYFAKQLRHYAQEGIKCYSELILGLPGETLQSFCEGIAQLLELGQHQLIIVYHCFLLPNSILASPELRASFQPQVVRTLLLQSRTLHDNEDIPEYIDTIVATNTLCAEDWLTAALFHISVHAIHCLGLLRLVAIYLHEKCVKYDAFYSALNAWSRTNRETIFSEGMHILELYFLAEQQGLPRKLTVISEISDLPLNEEETVFALCLLQLDRFFTEIADFLRPYFSDADIFENLLRYQKEMIRRPNEPQKELRVDYDFPSYFNAFFAGNPIQLQKKNMTLHLFDPQNPVDWGDWHSRTLPAIKGTFGGMYYTIR